MAKNMKPVPEVGEYYHFWDDGKSAPGRHYICRVERVLTKDEAKNVEVFVPDWDNYQDGGELDHVLHNVYDVWKGQVEQCDWLYAEDTDYIVEISCPIYDDNLLYAVRIKRGGWFTFDVQSSWQSGLLDVDGTHYEQLKEDQLYGGWVENEEEFVELYPSPTEVNWKKR